MSVVSKIHNRRIIPRWRLSRQTADYREAASLRPRKEKPDYDVRFAEKLQEWSEDPSFVSAIELVSAAVVSPASGQVAVDEVLRAARLIQKREGARFEGARALVGRLIDSPREEAGVLNCNFETLEARRARISAAIHSLRRRLRDEPRNGLLWVDLSRRYTDLGHRSQARMAMNVALGLDNSNRFVVRSGVRLLLHIGDSERAHRVARSSPYVGHDPWVMAAEVSAAALRGVTSRFIKAGERMLKAQSFAPIHLTELASALGTEHLYAGNTKWARRLFRQALEDPTENTLAQVEWGRERDESLGVGNEYHGQAIHNEARAGEYFHAGQWEDCFEEACLWAEDQPFSTWPVTFGSYVASHCLDDNSLSEVILRRGLLANPQDTTLLNNMAYALACNGKLDDAEACFGRIGPGKLGKLHRAVYLATRGLLHYRRGNPAAGARCYTEAMEAANQELRALVALYFAREEIRLGSAAVPNVTLRAETLSKSLPAANIRVFRDRVLVERERLQLTESQHRG